MSSTVEASVFMGKDYSEKLCSIKKQGTKSQWKKMFDISGKILHGNIYFCQ